MQNDVDTVEAASERMFIAIIEILADTSPVAPQRSHQTASFIPHDDFDITIIWHNIDARSNFTCFRKESRGPIKRILIDFARVLETGVLEEVISINGSRHMFCVTIACSKNKDEGIMDAILSVL
jgi:hypothetical protein